jgi:hypothetical protein
VNTAFLLMARYDGLAVIPIERVREDFFTHLCARVFRDKLANGEISIPVVRIEAANQKAALGIHLADLAAWIDERRAAAVKECAALQKGRED